MSVLIETSAGDLVIDLLVDYAPKLCENFLKLCKVKYYNFAPVHSIQKNFSFQTGDPLGPLSAESDGGTSIFGLLSGNPAQKSFPAEFNPKLKHAERGTVSMATVPAEGGSNGADEVRLAGSQFIVTLGDETDFLDGKAAIFGKVVEGFDVLEKINGAFTDSKGHPLVDIRMLHTIILDDPFPDPEGLTDRQPPESPVPTKAQLATVRIESEDALKDDENIDEEEKEKRRREREARAQALTLEMMGDLPFADVKPPENVLFVCKLNPVTTDEDLSLIFSRFGRIVSCEVIRDKNTGDSLQYAFIEFDEKEACERAYFKMQDVLIDDRRIHVDFSQSVSKLSDVWRDGTNKKRQQRRGGGWGGVSELEKRSQYRNEEKHTRTGDSYGMVYGTEEMKSRMRSRSPRGSGQDWNRDGDRPRERERDLDRDRDYQARDRDRDRDRDGDRHSHHDKRRNGDRDRDRHRVKDRDRERDRNRGRNSDRDRNRDRNSDRDRPRYRDADDRDRCRRKGDGY